MGVAGTEFVTISNARQNCGNLTVWGWGATKPKGPEENILS